MKPEDRKRLKQHIEMIVEHKEPTQTEKILRDAVEEQIKRNIELEDKNRKLRLELYTLRFKEAQENRFVWWIYNVYSRNVCDLIYAIMGATTYDTEGQAKEGKYALPKECFELMKRIDEYTEHIYDGTYLDTAMSTEQSNSDVSITQDVLTDVKTPRSIENNNPDYYKDDVGKWIPIASGRLPEKFQKCIVLDKNKRVHNWIHDDVLLPIFAQYTHWMPLPELPEEVK